MNLNSGDLEKLRVFFAIVQANGIANAQGVLNKDASTISRALTQLEERLQLRLCERGRQGFALTPEGRAVHAKARELFMSLRGFEQTVESVRGIGGGALRLATIDNVIADNHCPLVAALRDFMQPQAGRDIDYSLTVLTPEAMERQLLDKRIDLALGVFESPHELLEYTPLYDETDHLYAAAAHPASDAGHDTATLAAVLSASRFASRSFLDDAERALLGLGKLARVSHASNLEALLALILTGQYVGFMPAHYARPWVETGALQRIDPTRYSRRSTLKVAIHRDSASRAIVTEFLVHLTERADSTREPA